MESEAHHLSVSYYGGCAAAAAAATILQREGEEGPESECTECTGSSTRREKRSKLFLGRLGGAGHRGRLHLALTVQFSGKSLLVQRPRAVRIPRAPPRLPDAREPVHKHVDTSRAVARGSCPKAVSQRAPRSVTLTSGAIETAEHVHLSRTTQRGVVP